MVKLGVYSRSRRRSHMLPPGIWENLRKWMTASYSLSTPWKSRKQLLPVMQRKTPHFVHFKRVLLEYEAAWQWRAVPSIWSGQWFMPSFPRAQLSPLTADDCGWLLATSATAVVVPKFPTNRQRHTSIKKDKRGPLPPSCR